MRWFQISAVRGRRVPLAVSSTETLLYGMRPRVGVIVPTESFHCFGTPAEAWEVARRFAHLSCGAVEIRESFGLGDRIVGRTADPRVNEGAVGIHPRDARWSEGAMA